MFWTRVVSHGRRTGTWRAALAPGRSATLSRGVRGAGPGAGGSLALGSRKQFPGSMPRAQGAGEGAKGTEISLVVGLWSAVLSTANQLV